MLSAIVAMPGGLDAAQSAVVRERQRIVAELQLLVRAPGTTETEFRAAIGSHYWIFGGQYVGIAGTVN